MIKSNFDYLEYDIHDVVNLFFPEQEIELEHKMTIDNNQVINECILNVCGDISTHKETNTINENVSKIEEKRMLKRFCKLCVYKTLSNYAKRDLPWGSLTGIRPTKIAYELLENGVDKSILKEVLIRDFYISNNKAQLVCQIVKNQNCIIRNDKLIDFYINVPICPSRCSYCSFISSQYDKVSNIIDAYVNCVIQEIEEMKKLVFENAYIVRNIYIGGGTPTVLNVEQLDRILSTLNYSVSEFTVESGRPDTITREKLEVMKKYGVTRICINPQTFCKKTLKLIGRNHTLEQVFEAYKLALELDFVVNMDFIAGLPEESLITFKKTIKTALEFAPHNITVHTLSYKKGSELVDKNIFNKKVSEMIDFAYSTLTTAGYKPYYMYRQKNQVEGLENVGYCLPNFPCVFNIDSMEETNSIIACGANAISKRVFSDSGKIDRCANVKMIDGYISRINEMIERKKQLFSDKK